MEKRRSEAGLTLVEVLLAFVIIGIAISPLLTAFVTSRRNADFAAHQTDALALARSTMDRVITQPYGAITNEAEAEHPLDAGYRVQVSVEERNAGILKDVLVRVKWQRGSDWYRVDLYSAVYNREG